MCSAIASHYVKPRDSKKKVQPSDEASVQEIGHRLELGKFGSARIMKIGGEEGGGRMGIMGFSIS